MKPTLEPLALPPYLVVVLDGRKHRLYSGKHIAEALELRQYDYCEEPGLRLGHASLAPVEA